MRKFKTKYLNRVQGPKLSELRPVEEEKNDDAPRIVRTKRFALKPMSTDEAVMQMELLGHSFFVFRNATTQEVNVVYRRKDGNYGLIEPE